MIKPGSLYQQHNDVIGGPKFYLVLESSGELPQIERICLTERGEIVLMRGDYNIRHFYDRIA